MRDVGELLDSLTLSLKDADWGIPRRILHENQVKVKEEARRFNVVACGRRWGKTILGQELVLDDLQKGKLIAWGAPTYKLLEEPMRDLFKLLEPHARRSSKTDKVIEMPNGGRVDFWTLKDEDPGRGFRYHKWIIDEAAMIDGLSHIWQASIRPTLTDFKGGLWMLSTPRGPVGFFAERFREGQGDGNWKSWRMPTVTNPHIDDDEVEEARRQVTESVFRQEYLAEFVMPAGAVFDCFDPEKNTYDPAQVDNVGCAVMLGWDFGPANTASAIGFEKEGVLHIPYSYHASGEHPAKHVNHIREKIWDREVWAAGGSNSEDKWRKDFQDAGMKIIKPKITGQDSYSVAVNIVYYLFATGKLKISKDCKELIEEITSMRYMLDPQDKITDKVEDRNSFHRYDALRSLAVTWADPPVKVKKLGSRLR